MQDRKVIRMNGTPAASPSSAVVAGGLVFVSGISGMGPDGKPAGTDITTQTRAALDRLRDVLAEAGSSLMQTLSVQVYLERAADFDAMNAVYRQAFPAQPPARTTVVADLPPDLLVTIAAIAAPSSAPREALHPVGWAKSPRPYSYVVRSGDLVFLSGLLSRRGSDDAIVAGPAGAQTRTILDNAGVLLRTAGLSFADVVASRVFITSDLVFNEMNDEYRKYFTTEPPARATAVVDLVTREAQVEITLIASAAGKQVLGPAVSPSLPLSSAVRTGDLLFLSGVLGNTAANTGDVVAQTREVFARIRRTLEGAGVSFSHVADNTVYLSDIWEQRRVDAVTREIFPSDPPAQTAVGTRLVNSAAMVEMMMTATGR
jgi:enamine deaminase RidA (YjgF/YER057c/UK114 family)